ncbi:YadA-like family protein [Campylobacter corcagiensis]|uniref:YadA-like family protein n=1 Tax=Campylobacter corcagiensis TaxID=1448857 RepID=A0A7M1LGJ0_9BACT|nr:YadA-like family protein [Campylobacter corcagiensis]QKF65262.1 putative autotransporter adhesin (YadA domain) [Campylobacter corcagiensis]QOQ86605.1 YadA-like family protein [Campylobacter corcagiensis]
MNKAYRHVYKEGIGWVAIAENSSCVSSSKGSGTVTARSKVEVLKNFFDLRNSIVLNNGFLLKGLFVATFFCGGFVNLNAADTSYVLDKNPNFYLLDKDTGGYYTLDDNGNRINHSGEKITQAKDGKYYLSTNVDSNGNLNGLTWNNNNKIWTKTVVIENNFGDLAGGGNLLDHIDENGIVKVSNEKGFSNYIIPEGTLTIGGHTLTIDELKKLDKYAIENDYYTSSATLDKYKPNYSTFVKGVWYDLTNEHVIKGEDGKYYIKNNDNKQLYLAVRDSPIGERLGFYRAEDIKGYNKENPNDKSTWQTQDINGIKVYYANSDKYRAGEFKKAAGGKGSDFTFEPKTPTSESSYVDADVDRIHLLAPNTTQTTTPMYLGNVKRGIYQNDAVNLDQLRDFLGGKGDVDGINADASKNEIAQGKIVYDDKGNILNINNSGKKNIVDYVDFKASKGASYVSISSTEDGNINSDAAIGENSIAIGPNAKEYTSLNPDKQKNNSNNVALGSGSTIGDSDKEKQDKYTISNSVAIGSGTTVKFEGDAKDIGFDNDDPKNITIGLFDNATALGANSKASHAGATALGGKSVASAKGSVALGLDSVADRGSLNGLDFDSGLKKDALLGLEKNNAGYDNIKATLQNTEGAVSVGGSYYKATYHKEAQFYYIIGDDGETEILSDEFGNPSKFIGGELVKLELDKDGNPTNGSFQDLLGQDLTTGVKPKKSDVTRQITNVAAGSKDSDAVNVAQLKAVQSQGFYTQANLTDATATKVTDNKVHHNLGGIVKVVGDSTETNLENLSGENLSTSIKSDGSINLLMSKAPKFDEVKVGATNPIAIKKDGDNLKFEGTNGGKVNLTNINDISLEGHESLIATLNKIGTGGSTASDIKYFSVNSTEAGNKDNKGATATNSIAIGPNAQAKNENTISIGNSAGKDTEDKLGSSIFIGENAGQNLKGYQNVNMSYPKPGMNSAGAIAIGKNSGRNSLGDRNLFLGASSGAKHTGSQNIFIGDGAKPIGKEFTDNRTESYKPDEMATYGNRNIIIGNQHITSSDLFPKDGGNYIDDTISIGTLSKATGQKGIAIGSTNVNNHHGAQAFGESSIAIGSAFGTNYSGAKSLGDQSVAIGAGSLSNEKSSIAIGAGAEATKNGSIALGANSTASRGQLTSEDKNDVYLYDDEDVANTVRTTAGAVSVGVDNGTTKDRRTDKSKPVYNTKRQITNVAAGSEDSDAVNVAQLKAAAGFMPELLKLLGVTDKKYDEKSGDVWDDNSYNAQKKEKISIDPDGKLTKLTLGEMPTEEEIENGPDDGVKVDYKKSSPFDSIKTAAKPDGDTAPKTLFTTINDAIGAINEGFYTQANLSTSEALAASVKDSKVKHYLGSTIKVGGDYKVPVGKKASDLLSGENLATSIDENGNINLLMAKTPKFNDISISENGDGTGDYVNLTNWLKNIENKAGSGSDIKYFSVKSNEVGNKNNNGASGIDSIAIGPNAKATAQNVVSIGESAGSGVLSNHAGGSVFIGKRAGFGSSIIDPQGAKNWGSVYIGQDAGANAKGDGNLYLGSNTGYKHQGSQNIFLGDAARNLKDDEFFGDEDLYTKGNRNIAIGTQYIHNLDKIEKSKGTINDVITIGTGARANANNGIAIGSGVEYEQINENDIDYIGTAAVAENSIAIGSAVITKKGSNNSVSFGYKSAVEENMADAVALGSYSVANRGALNTPELQKGVFLGGDSVVYRTAQNTKGAISVGFNDGKFGSDNFNRQITNVAAGTKNEDAVNVAQLKAVVHSVASVTGVPEIEDGVLGMREFDFLKNQIGVTSKVPLGSAIDILAGQVFLDKDRLDGFDTNGLFSVSNNGSDKQAIKPNGEVKFAGDDNIALSVVQDGEKGAKVSYSLNSELKNITKIKNGNDEFTFDKGKDTSVVKKSDLNNYVTSGQDKTAKVAVKGKGLSITNDSATEKISPTYTLSLNEDEVKEIAGTKDLDRTIEGINTNLGKKADLDAGNLKDADVTSWKNKLGVSDLDTTINNFKDKGMFKVSTNGSNPVDIKAGDIVDFTAGNSLGDENLVVSHNGAKINYTLNSELKNIKSIGGEGKTITFKQEGVDFGGSSLKNIAPGQGDNDAVTKAQLDNAIRNPQNVVKVDSNSPLAFVLKDEDGNYKQLFRKEDPTDHKMKFFDGKEDTAKAITDGNGNFTADSGMGERKIKEDEIIISTIDPRNGTVAGSTKIQNVKNGTIDTNSLEAINGSQLHALNSKIAEILGGDSKVDKDGNLQNPTYKITNQDGTTKDAATIGDAIKELNSFNNSLATKGLFTVSDKEDSKQAIKPNYDVKFLAGDNLTTKVEANGDKGAKITYSLNKALTGIESITGDKNANGGKGLIVKNDGGKEFTFGDGNKDSDVITKSQLNKVKDGNDENTKEIKKVLGVSDDPTANDSVIIKDGKLAKKDPSNTTKEISPFTGIETVKLDNNGKPTIGSDGKPETTTTSNEPKTYLEAVNDLAAAINKGFYTEGNLTATGATDTRVNHKLGSTIKIGGTSNEELANLSGENLATSINKDGSINLLMAKTPRFDGITIGGEEGKPETGIKITQGKDGQDGEDGNTLKFTGKDQNKGVTLKGIDGINGKDGKDLLASSSDDIRKVLGVSDDPTANDAVIIKDGKLAKKDPSNTTKEISPFTGIETVKLDNNGKPTIGSDGKPETTTTSNEPKTYLEAVNDLAAAINKGFYTEGNLTATGATDTRVNHKLGSTIKIGGTSNEKLANLSGENLATSINKDGSINLLMAKTPRFDGITIGGEEGKPETGIKITQGKDGQDGEDGNTLKFTGKDQNKGVTLKGIDDIKLPSVESGKPDSSLVERLAKLENNTGSSAVGKIKFAADDEQTTQLKDNTLTINGDGKNIKTSVDGDGIVKISLNDKISFGGEGLDSKITLDKDGLKITNSDGTTGPSVTKDGINGGNKKLTNLASGLGDKTLDDIKKAIKEAENDQSKMPTEASNAATIGDLASVDSKVTNITNISNNINNIIGGNPKDKDGNPIKNKKGNDIKFVDNNGELTDDGKEALTTNAASGQDEVKNTNIIQAINNINKQGTKFFHVNSKEKPVGQIEKPKDPNDSSAGSYGGIAVGMKAEVGDNAKHAIAIGTGAQALAENTISIGYGNIVRGKNSGAIGDPSIIDSSDSYSVGNNNKMKDSATSNNFILGNNAEITSSNSVALGEGTKVTVDGGVALGSGSASNREVGKISGYDISTNAASTKTDPTWLATAGAVAVGGTDDKGKVITRQITGVAAGLEDSDAVNVAQLKAVQQISQSAQWISANNESNLPKSEAGKGNVKGYTGSNSVAIGPGSTTHIGTTQDGKPLYRENTVSVGGVTKDERGNAVLTQRTISNVADPVFKNDAVNLGYLNNRLGDVYNKLGEYKKDASAGTASAMAIGNIPQSTIPGKGMISLGSGFYDGESAMAIGLSKMSDDGKWVFKGSASYDSQEKAGAALSVGYHF